MTGCRRNGHIRALCLSDGTIVRPSTWWSARGSTPRSSWLAGSGLDVSRGVPVDPHGRTAIGRVFAAGDAAATFDESSGTHVPGSHWEAAGRQGARAGRLMLGLDPGRPR